jgi:SWI/SNF-related matrix-associated actin-dependent regulator of chromatin subfamily A protein 2/4
MGPCGPNNQQISHANASGQMGPNGPTGQSPTTQIGPSSQNQGQVPGSTGPIGAPVNQMSQTGSGQIGPAGPPTGPPGPGQENLNALQKAIDSMEEKGLQEDPRYSQLLALRARQGSGMGEKQAFNSQQLQQLRYVLYSIYIHTIIIYRKEMD